MCTASSMGGHTGVHLFRSPVLVLAEKKEHRLSLVEPSTKRFGKPENRSSCWPHWLAGNGALVSAVWAQLGDGSDLYT